MTRTTLALAAAALIAPLAASADNYGYDYGHDYGYTAYDYGTTYGYGHGYHYDPAPYINHLIHQQIPTPYYGNGNHAPVYNTYQPQPVTYGYTGWSYGYGY